jgi:pimeloyl-ACP methyl ester carboxylesterase/quercetin dioxygenase-like cupin family protein
LSFISGIKDAMKASLWSSALGLSLLPSTLAHESFTSVEVRFTAPAAEVTGTLLLPPAAEKVPCVVLVGGTLSQTRDGRLVASNAPPRDAIKRLAEALVAGGYASLRYDKVGYGGSKPRAGWQGTYHDEASLAVAAMRFARGRDEIGKVVLAGESAGAYLICLAAKEGALADAYVFLGGLCSPSRDMYEYNFGRLLKYADSSPERKAWAEEHARRDLAIGRHYQAMLEAAAAGKQNFELVDGDVRMKMGLARRQEELKFPPDATFRHIQAPALALAGQKDMNVPPHHAARIVQIIYAAGNTNVASYLIPGADHSFQLVPEDAGVAFRERYTFESFKHPYVAHVYSALLAWLDKTVPSPAATRARGPSLAAGQRAVLKPEVDLTTDSTPERLQLAPGIEIIDDVMDKTKTAGVETLEGRIGPLLLAESCQTHFIDMPVGMFLEEHPHSSESIIYTVRGRWVLCSQGRRRLMKPGSLFRFAANISTGYEMPFDEPAYLLIFKGDRTTRVEKDFIDYLRGLAERLKREQQSGVPFLLKELPADHPARAFARQVNPAFEAQLGK